MAIVRNATFNDIVIARKANLDFTVAARKGEDETTPNKVEQIKLILESAASVVASEGLKDQFILVKRVGAARGESLPWKVRISHAGEVESAVASDPEWMIFGEEYWERENAD